MATVIPQVSIADLVFNKSTPDTVGALQAGLNLSGTFQDQRRATQQEQALLGQQQLAGQASQELLSGNQSPQALAQLMGQNPEMAGKILKQAGIFNQQGRDELARTAFEIESIPAGPQRNARIQEVAEQLKARGGNPNIALGLLNLDGATQDRQLQNMQLTAMSAADRQGIAEGTRSFDLQERQFNLNQQNVASQIAQRQAPKIPAKTTIEKNLELAGFIKGTPTFQQEVLKFIKKPVGTTVTIGDTKTLSKATEGQLASAGFANRMANAAFDINKLEDGGFDSGTDE